MKILVIQQKMIGDVLTSSILFELLREKHPNAELHYLINSHTFSVVEHNPNIDKFIFFTPKIENSKLEFFRFLLSIRKENYDVVIDAYSKLTSLLITIFSGAKIKISKYKTSTRFVYNNTVKYANTAVTNASLAIENRLKLLQPLGIDNKICKPKIYLTKAEIDASKLFLEQNQIDVSKPILMMSVLGSSTHKTYPLKYMAQLIDAIVLQTQGQVLFNYIPKQLDEAKAVYNLCKKNTQKHIYIDVFGDNLRMFLALTIHCTAVIGNEGGAINMAKALNIPTFTIFSPGLNKENWNMFEDGKTHVSVHLNDFIAYSENGLKDAKKNSELYYLKFNPDYIKPKLTVFLNALSDGL